MRLVVAAVSYSRIPRLSFSPAIETDHKFLLLVIVGCGLSIITCFIIKWWCARKNKALELRQNETGEVNSWRFVS